jgi:hypothetical protein
MWNSFIAALLLISVGAAAGYGTMAGSTSDPLTGVKAGILAVAVMLMVLAGTMVSNIRIITYHILRFQNCGL